MRSLQELLHVALYLRRRELHIWVLQQTRQVVIHVGEHHVDVGRRHGIVILVGIFEVVRKGSIDHRLLSQGKIACFVLTRSGRLDSHVD